MIIASWNAQASRVTDLFSRKKSPHHDDVIKWKHFPRYWPFVRGIHRSPVNSPHKGQWRGALMFTLICARINVWVNNRKAGDLRRNRVHYDVIVMTNRRLVVWCFHIYFLCCYSEQAVGQTDEFMLISDAMTLGWCHFKCNWDICVTECRPNTGHTFHIFIFSSKCAARIFKDWRFDDKINENVGDHDISSSNSAVKFPSSHLYRKYLILYFDNIWIRIPFAFSFTRNAGHAHMCFAVEGIALSGNIYCDDKCRNKIIISREHDDVIKWKHFPRYWPFVRGIHRTSLRGSDFCIIDPLDSHHMVCMQATLWVQLSIAFRTSQLRKPWQLIHVSI